MTDYRILRTERTGYPFPVYEEKIIGRCSICGRTVLERDSYITVGFIDPGIVCEDCKYDDAS